MLESKTNLITSTSAHVSSNHLYAKANVVVVFFRGSHEAQGLRLSRKTSKRAGLDLLDPYPT